jgi:preflagellin peptidase FlaK
MALGVASLADLLRLLVVPVFAWAAYRDVRTRRLPNWLWPPLVFIGVVALTFDVFARLPLANDRLFLVQTGFALGFLLPFAFLAYWFRAFGGADAKAIATLAVVFPVTPTYRLPATAVAALPPEVVTRLPRLSFPMFPSVFGYVVWLTLRNLAAGRLSLAMVLGRPTPVEAVTDRHGTLLVTDGWLPRTGLDLDALRMYLRWRGCTLAELRADQTLRNPDTVTETFEPTDGARHREPEWPRLRDGGPGRDDPPEGDRSNDPTPPDEWAGTGFVPAEVRRVDGGESQRVDRSDPETTGTTDESPTQTDESPTQTDETTDTDDEPEPDPWAAAAFLDDIDGSAYGTTPERLRAGLESLTAAETVWVSPGLPFVVPLFGGLVVESPSRLPVTTPPAPAPGRASPSDRLPPGVVVRSSPTGDRRLHGGRPCSHRSRTPTASHTTAADTGSRRGPGASRQCR